MTTRSAWMTASAIVFGLIALLHLWLSRPGGWHGTSTTFQLVYSFGYFVFGVAVLGAVARVWPQLMPPMWRLIALASAASLGLVEFWAHGAITGKPLNLDTWAAALLGIAVAAMAPRLVPPTLLRRWLDQDRRRGSGP